MTSAKPHRQPVISNTRPQLHKKTTYPTHLAELERLSAEGSLVDFALVGAAERHAVVLKLDDGLGRLPSHVVDGVLIAQPVGALHRVVPG